MSTCFDVEIVILNTVIIVKLNQHVSLLLCSVSCVCVTSSDNTNIITAGWPRLTWFVAEHLPKPSRDWTPPPRPQVDSPAYIEVCSSSTVADVFDEPLQYSRAKDGSSLGVTVTRDGLLTHCRSLTTACHYREGQCC